MNRTKRTIKPTAKVLENQKNKHQVKKQEQKAKLKKKIEKRREVVEKELQKEVEDSNISIIRSDNDKIYKGLKYVDDELTTETKKIIDAFPDNFLPSLFKGLVPYYDSIEKPKMKTKVYLSKLKNGDYQTARSKSDKNIASSIKTVLKNFPNLEGHQNKDDLTDLIEDHRFYLYDVLQYSLKKKLSVSTIMSYLNTLVRLMNIAYSNPTKVPIYIKYATLSRSLREKQGDIDDENILNENERTRFILWESVLNKQKELEYQFNSIQNKKSREAYNINLDLILISLYSLRPPLRQEIMGLEFKNNKYNTGQKDKDYVYFKRNEVILDLNLDKKRHSAIEFEVEGKLADILKQSYELYPRQYLFTDYRNYPKFDNKLKPATVADRLKRMFKGYGVNVGASILRSSFVTYWFKQNPNFLMTEVKKIATKMRSSHTYLLTSYRKIFTEQPVIVNQPIVKEEVRVKEEQVDDNNQNNDRVFVSKLVEDPYVKKAEQLKEKYHKDEEYREKMLKQQKKYREEVGRKELQRRKIISQLRHSPEYRKSIKQSTLDKYGINLQEI